jgi:ABC-type phosphate transport system auxiliary subunit
MTPETKEAGSKLLISVLTIVTTIVAGNFGVDYRASERTQAVHDEVSSVSTQNREILLGIGELLDKKLEATASGTAANVKMNTQILQGTSVNKDLNTEILEKLETLQTQIDAIKGVTK